MKLQKAIATTLATATLLLAGVASAQTTIGSGPDLAVSVSNAGITLSAVNSTTGIRVMGMPVSISGIVGGTCVFQNNGVTVGVLSDLNNRFTSDIVLAAGGVITLPVTCTGANPGTYTVTFATSLIPAVVDGTNTGITPRGVGGAADNDTTAVGTLTIGPTGSGTITPGLPNTGGTGGTGGTTVVPGVPNTGAGGTVGLTLALLAVAGIAAAGGFRAFRKFSI